MSAAITRRKFITRSAMASMALPLLSYLPGKDDIRFGYSAITWGGNDVQAIKDISSLGFKGIQLRANTYPAYKDKPEVLKQMLSSAGLELAMFSSGNADINTGDDEAQIVKNVNHAKFVKSLGGKFIQVTNGSRPKTGAPTDEDLVKYARMLTEIGKRTKPLGIEVAYHNHMHQLGETPHEVDVIIQNSEPAYVNFLLDVAHYQQGGGDPAEAIIKYKSRLKALHIKDVRDRPAEDLNRRYIFVELGQGRVDFPAIFKALNTVGFKGYAIVELDGVPDKEKTPLQCAITSRDYLKKLGFTI
jgi:inosose dehydratase